VPERTYLTIGEVIDRLSEDFPDLTISKIRFLEGKGLIAPTRTSSGYRRFSDKDVEQLRWVLSAQRDEYLPLRVIRQRLAGDTKGDNLPDTNFFEPGVGELRLTRDQLAQAANLTPEAVADLETFGLIGPGPAHDGDALLVARAVADLGAHGIEPRHLRPLLTGARRTADLLGQVVEPLRHSGTRRPRQQETADKLAAELAVHAVRLHAALVRAALRSDASRASG
jgi:DNA-binding transcriptional MerR regulator